jgi:hypothetical protein
MSVLLLKLFHPSQLNMTLDQLLLQTLWPKCLSGLLASFLNDHSADLWYSYQFGSTSSRSATEAFLRSMH